MVFGVALFKVLSFPPLVRQKMRVFIVRHNQEDLMVLRELVEAGKVGARHRSPVRLESGS